MPGFSEIARVHFADFGLREEIVEEPGRGGGNYFRFFALVNISKFFFDESEIKENCQKLKKV